MSGQDSEDTVSAIEEALKDLGHLAGILRAIRGAVSIPVTIKIRTGWDADTLVGKQVCQTAYDEGMTWVAIHGRTRAMAYSGRADWNYIRTVKRGSPLPVIGNGDITDAETGVRRLNESGCDGVMIGRGCLKNPYIFRQAAALHGSEANGAAGAYVPLFRRLYELLSEFYPDRVLQIQIKKFAAWFSAGFPEASAFRRDVFSVKETGPLLEVVLSYFSDAQNLVKKDTSHEAFLMGGHG